MPPAEQQQHKPTDLLPTVAKAVAELAFQVFRGHMNNLARLLDAHPLHCTVEWHRSERREHGDRVGALMGPMQFHELQHCVCYLGRNTERAIAIEPPDSNVWQCIVKVMSPPDGWASGPTATREKRLVFGPCAQPIRLTVGRGEFGFAELADPAQGSRV